MPPKTMPLHAPPVPVQYTFGMNLEYLLPHQREQFRRHLQTITDLQDRKSKDQNPPQIDAAIAEARNQLTQLAQAAALNEQTYPTPEQFQAYIQQYNQSLQQRRAELTNAPASAMQEKLRDISSKSKQLGTRLKELEGIITRNESSDEDKKKATTEYKVISQQLENLKILFRESQSQQWQQPANNSQDTKSAVAAQVSTPPISQTQPAPQPVRSVPAPQQVAIQQQQQPNISQPQLPAPISMGAIPRPVVTNVNPPPARPTLSGGYPVGTPLLGTAPSVGASNAFTLAKDGDTRLLSKRKLQDLVKSIDPDERLEPDVEELLMEVADEFIDSVLQQSCKIARHRKGQMLEVRDVQLHLERNWNIRIPGFSSEEVRNVKKYNPTPGHLAKVGAVNQSKQMTKD